MTLFTLKVTIPPASHIEATDIRDLPNAGKRWAFLASLGSVGKFRIPLWVAVIVELSGRITVGPVLVGLMSSKGASMLM